MHDITAVENQTLQDKIHTISGLAVMLDSDSAELYQVETKNLNRAVARNIERFPQSFRFQLTEEEYENLRFQFGALEKEESLRSQIATLEDGRGKHSTEIYHIGASLKDLGKKWFAFSRFEMGALEILGRLK